MPAHSPLIPPVQWRCAPLSWPDKKRRHIGDVGEFQSASGEWRVACCRHRWPITAYYQCLRFKTQEQDECRRRLSHKKLWLRSFNEAENRASSSNCPAWTFGFERLESRKVKNNGTATRTLWHACICARVGHSQGVFHSKRCHFPHCGINKSLFLLLLLFCCVGVKETRKLKLKKTFSLTEINKKLAKKKTS